MQPLYQLATFDPKTATWDPIGGDEWSFVGEPLFVSGLVVGTSIRHQEHFAGSGVVHARVSAHDADSGELVWAQNWEPFVPVAWDASSREPILHRIALREEASVIVVNLASSAVECLDLFDGTLIWERPYQNDMDILVPGYFRIETADSLGDVLVAGGMVVVSPADGRHLLMLRTDDGTVIRKFRQEPPSSLSRLVPRVRHSGEVILTDRQGRLFALGHRGGNSAGVSLGAGGAGRPRTVTAH